MSLPTTANDDASIHASRASVCAQICFVRSAPRLSLAMAPPVSKLAEQATSAFLYGTTSLIILSFNKLVLTVYGFPSFPVIALAQFIVTVIIIDVLRIFNYVSYV